MRKRAAAVFAASLLAAGGVTAAAVAAPGAPAPKSHYGAKVSLYATGLKNPTSFTWGDGAMFAGDSGDSSGIPNGGVYVIRHHHATQIPSDLLFVAGVQFHKGVLYLSGGSPGPTGPQWQILAWSGWNGSTFSKHRVLYTAPQGFQGFNGIAFGPDGRLYVGVDTGLLNGNDHGPASTSPYLYDILSMNTRGKKLKVFAKGIRQPWQMAFASGLSTPFVSDLGQDSGASNPPDFILKVSKGQNYGFPKCNHTKGSHCQGYAKPFKTLSPHFDPMGIAIIGKRLYVGSFLGKTGNGGALYSMPLSGGRLKPVVTGFPAATDALAAHRGALYVGGSGQTPNSGVVYKVTLKKAAKKKATAPTTKRSTSPSFTG